MTKLRLEVIHRGRTVSVVEPDGDVVHVGRGRDGEARTDANRIVLDDPELLPEHARIVIRDETAFVEDPRGEGTVVLRRGQERRVLVAGEPLALAPSDVVELGP